MDKKKYISILVIIISAFIYFYYRSNVYLDPDVGWHVRMGQIILHAGIPKTDPFSYTMPSYPFIDHEWLTNILMTILLAKTGMIGVAAFFAFWTAISVGDDRRSGATYRQIKCLRVWHAPSRQ